MPKPVILDHDGGYDDMVALALLLTHPEKVNLIGCVCTDADCFVENAFNVTGKLMSLVHNHTKVPIFPIGSSSFHGVNPFPSEWRVHAKNMDDMPCLNIPENKKLWETLRAENEKLVGEQLLADLVMNSPEKVTICVTGPLSNVAWCINTYGEKFTSKVEECVIMGGAVNVGGNVFENNTDGTAEWNIYWDPQAAKTVLHCQQLRSVLFSLDSTNHVPVNSVVVQRFGTQNIFLLSQFVGNAWAMCTHYEILRPGDGYFAWDVLTVAYTLDNSVAELEAMRIDVEVNKTKSEGRTFCVNNNNNNNNNVTFVAKNVKAELFYDMVLSSMRTC